MKVLLFITFVITFTLAQEFTNIETFTEKRYFSFDKKFWEEILIGWGMATPLTWAKLYLPNECGKVICLITNDVLESIVFWKELNMLKEGWLVVDRDIDFDTYTINRNVYYFMASNVSVVGSIPELINSCAYRGRVGIIEQVERISDFLNEDILQIAKFLEYADTTIQMALRDEWAMVGVFAAPMLFSIAEGFVQLV